MIPQKIEIIMRLENGKSCSVIVLAYTIGLSTQIEEQ
jgi:hypothetical protein